MPLRPDLFHLLQDAHRRTRRLETAAYQALATTERAQRAALQARGLLRRRGRPLKGALSLPQVLLAQAEAIATFDNWCWLLAEIRQALEPLSAHPQLVSVTATTATLGSALALLRELGHADITAFVTAFEAQLPELLAPLVWLEQQLTPLLQNVDAATRQFLLWAWQQRHALRLDIETDIPLELRPLVQTLWDILALFHRSSSLAESLRSWLRPYLQIHRGMPQWLLPLLQLFWNHHPFERGKRAGSSPLELAGVPDAPTLKEVFFFRS